MVSAGQEDQLNNKVDREGAGKEGNKERTQGRVGQWNIGRKSLRREVGTPWVERSVASGATVGAPPKSHLPVHPRNTELKIGFSNELLIALLLYSVADAVLASGLSDSL